MNEIREYFRNSGPFFGFAFLLMFTIPYGEEFAPRDPAWYMAEFFLVLMLAAWCRWCWGGRGE